MRTNHQRLAHIVASVVIMAAATVNGTPTTNYVAASGSGADGLTWGSAWTTIQDAIDACADGDVILIKQDTYTIATALSIGAGINLTIRGGYAGAGTPGVSTNDPALTRITRSGNVRLLAISSADGWIENITFTNGYPGASPGGALSLSGASPVFTNCLFTKNRGSYGGAVYASGASSPTFASCRFERNRADPNMGGALCLQGSGTIEFDDCTFEDNYAVNEGGAILLDSSSSVSMNLTSCVLQRNNGSLGGAITTYTAGSMNLVNCLIAKNISRTRTYGAVTMKWGRNGTHRIDNCTIADNADIGVYEGMAGGSLVITNSILWGNVDDVYAAGHVLTYCCVEDAGDTGTGVTHEDPAFQYGYYIGSGGSCIDAGGADADALGLDGRYAQASQTDNDTVDLGYHFEAGFAPAQTDLYVGPGGTDSAGRGLSAGDPFASLTYAASVVEPGCTIHIAAGRYTTATETFPITLDQDDVAIVGTNAARTLLDAVSANQRILYLDQINSGTLLEGLTFQNGYATSPGGAIYFNNSYTDVRDCIFATNRVNNSYGGAAIVSYGNPTFSNCVFHGNRQTGSGEGGVFSLSGPVLQMTDCTFSNNSAAVYGGVFSLGNSYAGLDLNRCVLADNSAGTQGGAIYTPGDWHGILRNTLIVNNEDGGIYFLGTASAGRDWILVNCTVASNGVYGLKNTSGYLRVTNSIVYGNEDDVNGNALTSYGYSCIGEGAYNGVNGCTNVNPLFVDDEYFHLQSTSGNYVGGFFSDGSWGTSAESSPVIDRGDGSSYAREPMPNGDRINMGAYGNTPVASKSISLMPESMLFFFH